MSDTDLEEPAAAPEEVAAAEPSHDEDNILTHDFVDAVIECVRADDEEGARALVRPLHPADIADLFELVPGDVREPLASALAELLDGDVLAEMNDWVRDAVLRVFDASQVAALANELDTDDAVAII